jgi:hypothetical protein
MKPAGEGQQPEKYVISGERCNPAATARSPTPHAAEIQAMQVPLQSSLSCTTWVVDAASRRDGLINASLHGGRSCALHLM